MIDAMSGNFIFLGTDDEFTLLAGVSYFEIFTHSSGKKINVWTGGSLGQSVDLDPLSNKDSALQNNLIKRACLFVASTTPSSADTAKRIYRTCLEIEGGAK